MKFIQHFPAYIDFDPKTFEFKNIDELLKIEEINWWSKQPGFYGYFGSVQDVFTERQKHLLMVLYNFNIEYYGCTKWYVLGCITGEKSDGNLCDLLPIAEGKMGTHKITCCTRLANSIIQNHFFHMPKEVINRIHEDAKWNKNKPICVCDCGWNELYK